MACLPGWAHRCAAILAALVLTLAGLTLVEGARAEVLVVVTTPDLKSITEAVSGGAVRVETLVQPGADAEAFVPRPSHVALIRDAALVVRIGLGYDEWLDQLLRQTGDARPVREGRILDLSTDIALLEVQSRSIEARSGHAHGAANPHYWLDPANAEAMSARIAEAVGRVVPEMQNTITAAQVRFSTDLTRRLKGWIATLGPFQGAAIVAYHNSWPYFARRFRLNIVDLIEPKEGVAPSPARLASLAGRMRASRARAILHEPFEPLGPSRYLAERTGARVVVLASSVGSVPEVTDYLALFDVNVDRLAKALAEAQ
jgi:ABC-type Zn uptake system ZnuABC Zn-binding protein ZnuA